jgi:hypothetical protein
MSCYKKKDLCCSVETFNNGICPNLPLLGHVGVDANHIE